MNTLSIIVGVLATVVGGSWALYQFILHRTGKPRVALAIDVQSVESRNNHLLALLHLTIANELNVGIKRTRAFLHVNRLRAAESVPGVTTIRHFGDQPERTYEVFTQHTYLEPGERYEEDVLLQMPACEYVECTMEFLGIRPDYTWRTQRIFSLAKDEANSAPARRNNSRQASRPPRSARSRISTKRSGS